MNFIFHHFVLKHLLPPAREKGNLVLPPADKHFSLHGTLASETRALALAVLPNRARLFDTSDDDHGGGGRGASKRMGKGWWRPGLRRRRRRGASEPKAFLPLKQGRHAACAMWRRIFLFFIRPNVWLNKVFNMNKSSIASVAAMVSAAKVLRHTRRKQRHLHVSR